MNSSDEEIPQEILDAANEASSQLIPPKSKLRYEKEYSIFEKWCAVKEVSRLQEEVFMAYFNHLSKKFSPSSLWSKYSMIKSILKIKKNIDLGKYFKLTSYLKRLNDGYKPKKSKILEKSDIDKFLLEAPDHIYLLTKVATVFGIAGACRREELTNLTLDNIEEKDDVLIITIPETKTKVSRKFIVSDPNKEIGYISIYVKYKSLRPEGTPHRRFFVLYREGKCTKQCVGINTFGKMPANIAGYLKLPNPELYTGHCFRRSSATMLANSGSNITNIKRHGGWKSSTVAESYIEDSIENKKKIAHNILKNTSTTTIPMISHASTSQISDNLIVAHEALDMPDSSDQLEPRTKTAVINKTTMATTITCSKGDAPGQSVATISNDIYSESGDVVDQVRKAATSAMNLQCATNCTFNFTFNY